MPAKLLMFDPQRRAVKRAPATVAASASVPGDAAPLKLPSIRVTLGGESYRIDLSASISREDPGRRLAEALDRLSYGSPTTTTPTA